MARFVIFPGIAGSYADTADINLLDADTAHVQQSFGLWAGFLNFTGQPTLVNVSASGVSPTYGDNWAESEATGAGEAWVRIQPAPAVLTPETVVSQSYAVVSSVPSRECRLVANWRNAADGSISDSTTNWESVSDTVATRLVLTVTSPALAERSQTRIEFRAAGGGAPDAGDKLAFGACIQRQGSDATFQPSLRIVGTLFEAFNSTPDDPPIVFAADGTPLTVGDGWAGDLFTYSRHDGADASAPIVAIFDAEDIGLP